jgi:lupus La protein
MTTETEPTVAATGATTTTTTATSSLRPEVALKVCKQVEFYFSDVNLPKDKFLQAELQKNPEGWISLAIICSFSRMRTLTEDVAAVAEALKASELVEVSESGIEVRRKPSVPVEAVDCMQKGIFVRGFPVDATLEDLESFFAQGTVVPAEEVAAIRMRRQAESKTFKGSVFLVLKTEAAVEKAVELKTAVYTDEKASELSILSMIDFMAEQNEKALKRKQSNPEPEMAAEPMSLEQIKEMIVAVDGCASDLDHKTLRTALAALGPIAFVEAVNGEGVSVARFKEPVAAKIIEAAEQTGGVKVPKSEEPLKVRAVTDEEAEAFLQKLNEFKASSTGSKPSYKNNKRARRH